MSDRVFRAGEGGTLPRLDEAPTPREDEQPLELADELDAVRNQIRKREKREG